jgi:uncharacterized membrane protein
MPFCKNCGSPVDGQFCGKCGTPLSAPAAGAYPPPPAQPPAGASYGAPPQAAPAAGGLTDNVAGLLCYIAGFITGIVFLAIAPYNQNKFIRFHAFQSIFFSVAWFAFWVVQGILGMILPGMLFFIITLLSLLIWLGGMVIWILLMVKAYQGQKWHLPIIGPIAEKQA